MAKVKRLKHGTLQASLHIQSDTYRVERWDGTRWEWLDRFAIAHLEHLSGSYATKEAADYALEQSGQEWRK